MVSSCFSILWKGGTELHRSGRLRGSALSLVLQRWEAVFRRERMPASIDRTSIQRDSVPIFGSVAVVSRFRIFKGVLL